MKKISSHRLLSIDLDGTLLSPIIRKVSKKDCLSIQDFLYANGMPILNTGRPPYATYPALNKINKSGPNNLKIISCMNGAYIKDMNDDSLIESKIDHNYCKQLYEIVKDEKLKSLWMWFYLPRGIDNGNIESFPKPWWGKLYPIGHVKEISDLNDLSSYKISIISIKAENLSIIHERFKEKNLDKFVNITRSSKHLIEITNFGVDKGKALRILQNKYGITKENTCSIGDTFNDLAAFENSGLSIAVKPKSKVLADKVNHIVPRKRNGVTKAIYKYLLREDINQNIN